MDVKYLVHHFKFLTKIFHSCTYLSVLLEACCEDVSNKSDADEVFILQVTTPNGEEYLVSMPTKFRKNIWVKRGDYILVEPIAEGDKVKGEIVKIMNKDSIKYYKENNVWPKEFDNSKEDSKTNDDDDDLFVNTNRIHVTTFISDSESDSSDESDSNSGSGAESGK